MLTWPLNTCFRLLSSSPHIRKTIAKGLCLSLAVVLVIFLFEMAYFPAQIFFDEYDHHHEHYFQTWADTDEVCTQGCSTTSHIRGGSLIIPTSFFCIRCFGSTLW